MHRPLVDRVALVTGAGSTIGRACALALARGGAALAIPLTRDTQHIARDLREAGAVVKSVSAESVERAVDQAFAWRGRLDILVNHADARVARPIEKTEARHIDAMYGAHCRAALFATRRAVPYMLAQPKKGRPPAHIVSISPPLDLAVLPGRVAYSVAKLGMSLVAMGTGMELRDRGILVNALWPSTLIEGSNTNDHAIGDGVTWRAPAIVGDALVQLVQSGAMAAQTLLDEQVLRAAGVDDFSRYRCTEADAALALAAYGRGGRGVVPPQIS